ncbi:ATP synthase protein I [Evansella caseinilytica]|uniref:ATP synthase protein I n=1 Tax=Evansella caseinilytica TaxID=1503961 RepID=A0A1H3T736_9BACI|nr:ATP synthase subunit I [Evansella caseinilytica]SDZ45671.1 ATP synthase protein I [Evansella caseinilytica]
MKDYTFLAKRYSIYTAAIIFFFLLLALLFEQTEFFIGFAFGAAISLLNLINTYFQVKRIGKAVESGKTKWSFGTVSRILTSVFAVFIALEYPQIFDLTGVIIGLMVTYVMILFEPIFHFKHWH